MSQNLARPEAPSRNLAVWALAALLAVRLTSLGLYPVMDKTEARYAEIGRAMLALGDWITPWYDTNIPFWGKPPLSFWATAASFSALGVNEFAARLPHFLAALAVGGLVWNWVKRYDRQDALTTIALLAGSSLVWVAAGAVMTDMILLLGLTLSMRGFWLALHGDDDQRVRDRWLFFFGLSIGLLAKGPLALVLAGLPLGLWTLWSRQWVSVWRQLPWLGGTALTLVLVGPWYLAAEMRTPGFLNYFLVGEHWHRFVTPGWAGDRYGGAHSAPWGSIWIYAWLAMLPWSALLPIAWWRSRRADAAKQSEPAKPNRQKQLGLYLGLWGLAPSLFFTFAGNILWTYVLPGLPALAILGAFWLGRHMAARRVNRLLAIGLSLSAVVLASFIGFLNLPQYQDYQTTKYLVEHSSKMAKNGRALYFYPVRPYSAAFYSHGRAKAISQPSDLMPHLTQPPVHLAVATNALPNLPPAVQANLKYLASHGDYTLFSMGAQSPTTPQPAL